jgi:SAM-dependent methyltransferase
MHKVGNCSGHFSYNPALSKDIFWNICYDCNHVFTEGYYTEDACKIVFSKTQDLQRLGFEFERNRYVSARMIEKVVPFISNGYWLDIGFGNGSLLFTAQEYGFKPYGIDLRKDNVAKLASLGIKASCCDISELNMDEECAVISMMDVLEHMPYPKVGLTEASRLLKTGGVLFLSMPNLESLAWQFLDNQNINPYWGEMEHYHNFGRDRLYKLLKDFGFTPVKYGISERYRVCMEIIATKN